MGLGSSSSYCCCSDSSSSFFVVEMSSDRYKSVGGNPFVAVRL